MRRVAVTGVSSPLGQRVATALAGRNDTDSVVGIDQRDDALVAQAWARAPEGGVVHHRSMSDLVDAAAVDTIVHAAMCPSRSGAEDGGRANVILTLQVAAAASGRDSPVRTLVAVSSTEVYPAAARAPLWRREDEALRPRPSSEAGMVLEAEDHLRDVAEHHPHLAVSILRLADLAGPHIASPLGLLVQRPLVPFVSGYDPAVQLLHIDDAVGAITHAVAQELAGTYNVAGPGVVHWQQAARRAGGMSVPLPVLRITQAVATTITLPRRLDAAARLGDVLRFGRCVDTTALAKSGFIPTHTTAACWPAVTTGWAGRAG
jgi:UDP-glucose 4-epimerase